MVIEELTSKTRRTEVAQANNVRTGRVQSINYDTGKAKVSIVSSRGRQFIVSAYLTRPVGEKRTPQLDIGTRVLLLSAAGSPNHFYIMAEIWN